MLKKAKVTQIDQQNGLVKVLIPEENAESNWIPMLSGKYDLPKIGAMVRTLFDNSSYTEGLCLGEYFSEANLPADTDAAVSYIKMAGNVVLKYNSNSKTLEIFAGSVTIHGNLTVSGTLSAKNL